MVHGLEAGAIEDNIPPTGSFDKLRVGSSAALRMAYERLPRRCAPRNDYRVGVKVEFGVI